MKKIFLFTAGVVMAISAFSQQCLHEGIGLYTQEQVDRFQVTYPNCKEILGDVVISGDDIMFLEGLNGIEAIDGSLEILKTGRMFSIYGFRNLKSVGGHFDFYYNDAMTNLFGLDSLTTVGQDLEIYNNTGLTSLSGLQNLASVGKNLWIGSNPLLPDLNGFLSLASIGGLIQIDYNDALRNITALGTLKTIQGAIYINSNPRLMKLFGLDSINAGGIIGLTVTNNDSLAGCAVLSICRYLDIPYSSIMIHNNAKGCNSEVEVKAGCDTLSVENPAGIETVSFHPNPANGSIIVEMPGTSLNTRLVILNLNGEEVLSRVVSAPQDRVDISSLPPGIYFLKLVSEGNVAVSKLIKKSE